MTTDLYSTLLQRLQAQLNILEDKPEETAANTLNALWFAAAGTPLSAAGTVGKDRPLLAAEQQAAVSRLVDLRLTGVPLAYITGRQQFMGIELLAGPEALIPRRETEVLAASAMEILDREVRGTRQLRVMDLCTGAGNIALALALAQPRARVYAADISPDCIALTNRNIALHQVADRVVARAGDLFVPFEEDEFLGSMDLITCNPPYISSGKVGEMADEIAGHEPSLAFDGGPFGIAIINRLIHGARRFLRPGGWLAFEIGLGQGPAIIKRIEKKQTYSRVVPVSDGTNHIRVLLAQYPSGNEILLPELRRDGECTRRHMPNIPSVTFDSATKSQENRAVSG